MKLRRLDIQRLPGIDEGFALEKIGDGIQVIVGPNGSGKSSLIRALRALLWTDRGAGGYVAAAAVFEGDGGRWSVKRDGSRHRWQQDGTDCDPPPLPAAHLDGCFFLVLRDLLDAADDGGADLAREIRRQMSGGFDLDQVARALFGAIGPRYGRTERSGLREAERALREASGLQEALSRREGQLTTLEADLDEAKAAHECLPSYDDALALLRLREELEQVHVGLAALPSALESLTGNELSEVEQREAEAAKQDERRGEAESVVAAAGSDAAETRLPDPIASATLAAWRERAAALATLESQLGNARGELAKRRGERAAAARAAGGGDGEVPAIDLTGAGDLFAFLREATRLATEGDAIAQQLEILNGVTHSEEQERRRTLLGDGIGPLRAWLRAPDPAGGGAGSRWRSRLLWIAVALVAAGAGLGLFLDPGFTLLATAGFGIAVAAFLLRFPRAAGDVREAVKRGFPAALDPPDRWVEEAVEERLRELEGEAAELAASARRASYADADRSRLETRRADLEQRGSGLERRRHELARALNLETIPRDAELVDIARALDALRAALRGEASAAEAENALAEQYRTALAALAAEVTARGEPEPTDAASARAAVDSLRDRDNDLRNARGRDRTARQTLSEIEQDATAIEMRAGEVYERAGLAPGDRAGLARLLERLPEFNALRRKRQEHLVRIGVAEERLEEAGELGLIERTPVALAADRSRLEAKASRRADLERGIAEIRADVRRARERHDLEDAIAAREACRARLAACRERALAAAAGRFLLGAVKREHETSQMPRVLERARALFGRFTHHAYELRVAPDGAGSFIAVEAGSGAGYRPDQLSDGTRAQLLLAARLAFAEQVERAERLPLFLDEALDQSDLARFRAIARSLGRMAADEDRQIFYLTSDPTDAERIQHALDEEGCGPATVIDLAEVRGRAAAVTGPESLRVDALPEVPDPAGMTPEAYGAALGVPPLDPRRGHDAQHLFHLVWDDLARLHCLLARRIERVGQWRNLSRMGGPLIREIGAGPELDDRARLLEAFCAAWMEGRGRPVDRDVIERSEVVTDRYLDAVADVATELGGDAAKLIRILHERGDERLTGFREDKTEELERYLTDEGYLDPRPLLTESELNARLLSVPAAERLAGPTVAACAHRWWRLAERT